MIALLAAVVLSAHAAPLVRMDTSLPMSDGVRLWTRVVRPPVDEPVATVLVRFPYDRALGLVDRWCARLAGEGYACVAQLVRGRGDSEGEWDPFFHERQDGLDTLAWIRAQPWSDGHLGMVGDSYLAATAWAVLGDAPEGLDTIVSRVFGPDTYASMFDDGLFRHELATAWMSLMPDRRMRFATAGPYLRSLDHRPRTTMDLVAAGHEVPWFRRWIGSEDPAAPLWSEPDVVAFSTTPERTTVPVLMVGGWADTFAGPTWTTWQRLATRDRSLLVVGPWEHLGRRAADFRLRGVDDPLGDDGTLAQWPRVLAWLDHHLRGGPAPEVTSGTVVYLVGQDRWEHTSSWPPPSVTRTWWLQAGPDRCAGSLSTSAPVPATLGYVYDPADPLPAAGDAGMLAGSLPFFPGTRPGFRRQDRALCDERHDVLRFVGGPITAPLRLAGALQAELEVTSDAPDTAFVVRWLERRADGRELLVREDLTTLAAHGGLGRAAGSPVRVTLTSLPVDYTLQAGSQLVVLVTSSSYPRVDAHPNLPPPYAAATQVAVAHQELRLGASRIDLPVVPADRR